MSLSTMTASSRRLPSALASLFPAGAAVAHVASSLLSFLDGESPDVLRVLEGQLTLYVVYFLIGALQRSRTRGDAAQISVSSMLRAVLRERMATLPLPIQAVIHDSVDPAGADATETATCVQRAGSPGWLVDPEVSGNDHAAAVIPDRVLAALHEYALPAVIELDRAYADHIRAERDATTFAVARRTAADTATLRIELRRWGGLRVAFFFFSFFLSRSFFKIDIFFLPSRPSPPLSDIAARSRRGCAPQRLRGSLC
jgi:hypothetical protein